VAHAETVEPERVTPRSLRYHATRPGKRAGVHVYVHAPTSVAVPLGVVTTTFPVPVADAAPDVTVMDVEVLLPIVAATPSSVTLDALPRFVPEITVTVPPVIGPLPTEIPEMDGATDPPAGI
jgi:hypothetical protein